jgi:type IV pilus assembly protein PilB
MSSKKRIGELLIEAGAIDESQLQSALGHQRRWGGRIGQALLDMKLVTETALVEALARKTNFEVARLAELEPYAFEQAKSLVPREFAQRNNVFPLAADTSTITVAMGDPTNLALADELRFRTGRRVKVCIGGDREIAEAIRVHYQVEGEQAPEAIALDLETTGEGVQLADPFEGGSSDDMRAMMEPTWQSATVFDSPYGAPKAPAPSEPAPPPEATATPAPDTQRP